MIELPPQPVLISPVIQEEIVGADVRSTMGMCLEETMENIRRDNAALDQRINRDSVVTYWQLEKNSSIEAGAAQSALRLGAYTSYMALFLQNGGRLPRLHETFIKLAAPSFAESPREHEWHFAVQADAAMEAILELVVPTTDPRGERLKNALWNGAGLVSYLFNAYQTRLH